VNVELNCVLLYFILEHELHFKIARVQICRTWTPQFPAYYSCQQKHFPYNTLLRLNLQRLIFDLTPFGLLHITTLVKT